MTEQRFTNVGGVEEYVHLIFDNKTAKTLSVNQTVKKLNEQQDTIITLRRRLEKINGGYGHLTHRNGLTANEWLIESQERELKKKNEEISDWIERHSKDIAKIGEQQATISQLEEENEQLKQKIKHCVYVDVDNANGCMNCKYDEGSICSILDCGTHDYLEGVSECGLKYWECKDE